MSNAAPGPQLQLHSLIHGDGVLELSLQESEVKAPGQDQVLIRMEAAPINPSDLGLLFGAADLTTIEAGGTDTRPLIKARVPAHLMGMMAARVDQSLPVGNEGAGTVVAAGPGTEALAGRTVAVFGGATYARYRLARASDCLVLPEGVTAEQGASCFVNPLTALGMVETMRREGHKALVHTAAASNLGQMLNRICQADDIELVNIVRKPEQEALLRGMGARHVCNSGAPDFTEQLTEALAETGATIAFDATGGGELASQILNCMEQAAARTATEYSRYGSNVHKQVYIYGGLDRSPTILKRAFGFAWSIGGWLLPPFLAKIGPEAAQKLRDRVAAEVTTTFASHYAKRISLADALRPEHIAVYGRQATGEKYLIEPHRDFA
ncbi:MAG: zinc-binding dehydrogenase [Pseudomonadales bacterium]|jgi:NADPH2:quinone reductase|nr:zinc-binding dehydrogenase [Pseudomonadales bacterium]